RPAPRPHAAHPAHAPERPAAPSALDSSTKMGLYAAGALFVVTAIVVLVVKSKKDDERARIEAHNTEVSKIVEELRGYDFHDDNRAQRVINRASETNPIWKDDPVAGDIETFVNRAKSALDNSKDRKDVTDRVTKIEESLKSPEKLPPDQ